MRRLSLLALLLGLVPFLGVCFFVPAWDRVHPMVLGLPFNLFWALLWTVGTPICLWFAYRVETSRISNLAGERDRERPR